MKSFYLVILCTAFFCSAKAQSITASNNSVCEGSEVRLTASPCDGIVVWSNGKSGLSILDTLYASTAYKAACYQEGVIVFEYPETVEITVLPRPKTPYLFCRKDEIEPGESASIGTIGCEGTVHWSNGETGRSITVKPEVTTSYTATCINPFGCSADPISRTIIVIGTGDSPLPEVIVKYTCDGETAVLRAQGCTNGEYVWYKNTKQFLSNVINTQEVGRGDSIAINEENRNTFYTARCQFMYCLGEASNRIQIKFTNNLPQPLVSGKIFKSADETVDLNSVLSSPASTGGKFVFKTGDIFTSSTLSNATAIKEEGTYYVYEVSRLGQCISDAEKIIVENTDIQGLVANATDTPVLDSPTETKTTDLTEPQIESIKTSVQSTNAGAEISSTEASKSEFNLKIPEGFSPNGDGKNDAFVIDKPEDVKISLHVYNRFGHLVYEADDYNNDWKGEANAGGRKGSSLGLPDGTYYYAVKTQNGDQKISFVTLVR